MNPSDAQLLKAFDQAPVSIQHSLSDGSAVDFSTTLTARYGLHIDTAGYVTEFIRNMLLGFLRPEGFIQKLESIGITGDVARAITNDLNREVFIPLRDEMKRGGANTHPSSIPVVQAPRITVQAPPAVVAPTPAPAPIEPPVFNLIKDTPNGEAETLLKPPPIQTPAVSRSTAHIPMMRTMQHDLDLIQHGSQPVPFPAPIDAANLPHPSQMTPAQSFQTASVPFTTMPAPSIPIPPLPAPIREAQYRALPTPPTTQQPVSSPTGSSDPYRESI